MSELDFKVKIENVDPNTRSCLLYLNKELLKMKLNKSCIIPECNKLFELFDSKICKLIDIQNITTENVDSMQEIYNEVFKMDIKIQQSCLKLIENTFDETLKEHTKIIDIATNKLDEKIQEWKNIKDDTLDLLKKAFLRLDIEFELKT